MGRDFYYSIKRKGTNSPCEYEWDEIFHGNMVDGRNQWDGLSDDQDGFTRDEIFISFQEYIKYANPDDRGFRFTCKAFGQIISEMADDDYVYIKYY